MKAYLGLLTYYGHFLPNLSTVLYPLFRLHKKELHWQWSSSEQEAFTASKCLLVSEDVLIHYGPKLELVGASDASANGIGSVLSHKMPSVEEKPIPVVFASWTLSSAERNYSQVEKEALACFFAVKRFDSYIYGRRFTLHTDHTPLVTLLGGNKAVLPQASARIQRVMDNLLHDVPGVVIYIGDVLIMGPD